MAKFDHVILYDADLHDTLLTDAHLTGVDLRFTNLGAANLDDAHLFGADVHNANLTNANLYHAILFNAALSDADPQYAGVQFPTGTGRAISAPRDGDAIATSPEAIAPAISTPATNLRIPMPSIPILVRRHFNTNT